MSSMFGLLLRKTLYEMWDNFLALFIMNLGYVALLALCYFMGLGVYSLAPLLFNSPTPLLALLTTAFIIIISFIIISLYNGVVSCLVTDIADRGRPELSQIGYYIKTTWLPSVAFGSIQGLALSLIINASLFYLPSGSQNFLYYFLFFLVLWGYFIWMISAQYFFPLQARFDKNLKKNIRKMFILFFDNTAFTVFGLTLVGILIMGLSVFTAFLIPGLATLNLFYAVALKLRIIKYDYLEANPQASRKNIPWDIILAEEKEKTGKRSLRSFIFPWKD